MADAGVAPILSRLFRTLCVTVCAALVAVLSLHGIQESRHQIAHASDWPAAAIEHENHGEIVDVDHGSPHVHFAPDAPADDPLNQADSDDDEGNAERPVGHHHHSGGDTHTAIPVLDRDLTSFMGMDAVLLQPAVDGARPAHDGDGPDYPPKRTRTVI